MLSLKFLENEMYWVGVLKTVAEKGWYLAAYLNRKAENRSLLKLLQKHFNIKYYLHAGYSFHHYSYYNNVPAIVPSGLH